MKQIFLLLRPDQWLKNMFVFAPVFFSGRFTDMQCLSVSFIIFMAYCMAASGIYCFNDIYDAESDRLHQKKKFRPIASGVVSKSAGYYLMAICLLISFLLITLYPWDVLKTRWILYAVVGFYVVMNIAYCVWLKQFAIIDVFLIAIGFVLRIVAGSVATGIELTHWLVLMTFLLALFLSIAKRRDDVVMFESTGKIMRKNVVRYNLDFMNQAIGVIASITMVCYIMYTVSPEVIERFHCPYVYTTSIFVLAGIIRYLQVTIVDVRSGSPTKVLIHDKFVQACVLGWVLSFVLIIYFSR